MTDEDIQSIVEERDKLVLLCMLLMFGIERRLDKDTAKAIWKAALRRMKKYLTTKTISLPERPLGYLEAFWGK